MKTEFKTLSIQPGTSEKFYGYCQIQLGRDYCKVSDDIIFPADKDGELAWEAQKRLPSVLWGGSIWRNMEMTAPQKITQGISRMIL